MEVAGSESQPGCLRAEHVTVSRVPPPDSEGSESPATRPRVPDPLALGIPASAASLSARIPSRLDIGSALASHTPARGPTGPSRANRSPRRRRGGGGAASRGSAVGPNSRRGRAASPLGLAAKSPGPRPARRQAGRSGTSPAPGPSPRAGPGPAAARACHPCRRNASSAGGGPGETTVLNRDSASLQVECSGLARLAAAA